MLQKDDKPKKSDLNRKKGEKRAKGGWGKAGAQDLLPEQLREGYPNYVDPDADADTVGEWVCS
eukprot:SAG11_NODE_2552_length_3229_cov_1.244728_6_plen_63_part_00